MYLEKPYIYTHTHTEQLSEPLKFCWAAELVSDAMNWHWECQDLPTGSSLDYFRGAPMLNLPFSWKLLSGFSLEYFEMICESNFLQPLGAFVHILWSLGFLRLQSK